MMLNNGGQVCLDQNNSIKFQTTSTTGSNSSQQELLPQIPLLCGLKKSTSCKREWQQVHTQIMLWFASKNIQPGIPEDIHLEPTQTKKRQILMSNQKVELKADSLLGRRLGRSLTISL